MGEKTAISWTQHTWNPWRGCERISPGCARCYMFAQQERVGLDPNVVTRTKTWAEPDRWQRECEKLGKREMVFTCSWSDFFIEEADAWRPEAWAIIKRTPNLTYQILTKRPELIADRLPADWGSGYPNVWLGVSVENKHFLSRMDVLRAMPAVVRFISAEPLLENLMPELEAHLEGYGWCVIGGESGNGTNRFRPMEHQWARDMFAACERHGVARFFKQSAAPRTELGTQLDGKTIHEYPNTAKSQTGRDQARLFRSDVNQ
jgi:protein gp37